MDILTEEFNLFEQFLLNELSEKDSHIAIELKNFIFAKSKKLRPKTIFLFAKALGYEINEKIINLACATELIHNSTLIHDDIIDKSDIRRGLETFNHKFGNSLSVLYGDILLSLAMKFLTKCNNINCFNEFSSSMEKMCLGEINQHFQYKKIISIDEYIEKSKNKTAELYRAALTSLCHILNIKEIDKISDFAINFGIAFQIKDDLSNILTQDNLKPSSCDIENGVYTAPIIFLAEKYSDIEHFSTEKIKLLIKENPYALEKTINLIKHFEAKAIKAIDFIENNKYKQEILNLF
ncbi:polyprenyl synthetase family protein [bacterium]|nr:polyprenyl synthetase family protein [bacterium]